MDVSDEDEDVIFEHSPLHQSLKEAGLKDADLHVCKGAAVQLSRSTCKEEVPQRWKLSLESMRRFIMTFLGLTILSQDLQRLTHFYNAEILKLILKSKLMTEEDMEFLNTALPIRDTLTHSITVRPTVLVTLSLPCLLAYLYGRVVYPEMPWKFRSLTDVMAFLCLCYMVAVILKWVVLYHHQSRLTRGSKHIRRLVSSCEGLLRITARSLRLVQEAELVARGFTLVSQQTPVSRLEQNSLHSTQRQCPQLRASLFLVSRKAMLLAKDKTMALINCYPLSGDLDGALNYLAQVPVKEYGPCVQTDGDGEEGRSHLYNITDGFSVASLKGIKHLCDLHISELFRRLTFVLCYSGEEGLRLETTEMEALVTGIHTPISKKTWSLEQMYKSHACLIEDKGTQTPKYTPDDAHPLRETYMAVHSLDLHLQAAWLRVRSLSSLLETHIDHSSVGHLDHGDEGHTDQLRVNDAYDKLRLQVKHELHACKACWEEGISRLEKLEKVKVSKEANPLKTDAVSKEVQSDVPPIPLFEMGDPIIEDQVFEAYITEDPVESYQNTWDEFITPEEKAKKKKEKQEAMRLLMELKSVISVRATEREIRENKALEKSRLQSNGTVSDDNTSSGDSTLQGKVANYGKTTVKSAKQTPDTVADTACLQCDLERQSYDGKTRNRLFNCTSEELRVQMFRHLKDEHSTEDSINCKQTECDYPLDTLNEESNCNQAEYNKYVQDGSGEQSEDSESEHFSSRYKQRKVRLPEYTDSESEGEELVNSWCRIIQSERLQSTTENKLDTGDQEDYVSIDNPLIKGQETLTERVARLSGANMAFSSNVAAMAAARSRDMGLSEATFGDDDINDDSDEVDVIVKD